MVKLSMRLNAGVVHLHSKVKVRRETVDAEGEKYFETVADHTRAYSSRSTTATSP